MEMRAAEDIGIGQDLTPPLPPLAFSLYDSFLSSHCSSCFLPLPNLSFSPVFHSISHHGPPSILRYCSPLCSSLDSCLHFASAEHLLQPRPATDSSLIRLSLRLLHLCQNRDEAAVERIGGLLTNYEKFKMADDYQEDDDFRIMIEEAAKAMVLAEKIRDGAVSASGSGSGVMKEAIVCLVMTNAVEVQEKNGRSIGVAVYDTAFSWINHSCSPNACYRFLTAMPEVEVAPVLPLRISPAAAGGGCGSELVNNGGGGSKFKSTQGNGPRIIVRSIKRIKKGEEVTVAYTDLLQPKAVRQSELWSKYQFNCGCKRCNERPATYVDHALQGIAVRNLDCPNSSSGHSSYKEEAIEKLKDCFDDAIAEYLSRSNPRSCCEKLENLLTHGGVAQNLEPQEQKMQRNLNLHLFHHLSVDAYTTLASAYKVRASHLLAFHSEHDNHQLEAFDMSRASAAYALLLAGVTHHLFLSESSLIASIARFWESAGESSVAVAKSPVWEAFFKLGPAIPESSSFLNDKRYRSALFHIFMTDSFCSQDQNVQFEEMSKQFQNFIAHALGDTWSFLTHGCSFLKEIKDLDFKWLLTKEQHSCSEAILNINHTEGIASGSASGCNNQLRGALFQLGFHCLLYGAFLSSICYSKHSELVSKIVNMLSYEGNWPSHRFEL